MNINQSNTDQIFTTHTRKTALIVDDDIDVRISLSFIVTRHGFDIKFADNGIDAFEMYVENNPDIVFMDFRMPDMNGVDAVKKIREFDPIANVIFITGNPEDLSLLESIKNEHNQILEKPLEYSDITNILNAVNLK